MRHLFPLFAAMVLTGVPAIAGEQADAPLSDKAREALKDYEPVGTRRCIPLSQTGSSRIIDQTAIIYSGNSRTLYVNQPSGGRCTSLRSDRAIVSRLFTGNICNMDIIQVIDPPTSMAFGACSLGIFTEYRRKQ